MIYAGKIAQLLISEWIWSLTWGFYHNFINILFMLFLLKLFLGIRIIPAVLLSCCSQLTAFLFFNLFVISILVLGFGIEYDVITGWSSIPNQFYASFYLGLIYAVLQNLFFLLLNTYYKVHLSWVFIITLISNSLTVLLLNLILNTGL